VTSFLSKLLTSAFCRVGIFVVLSSLRTELRMFFSLIRFYLPSKHQKNLFDKHGKVTLQRRRSTQESRQALDGQRWYRSSRQEVMRLVAVAETRANYHTKRTLLNHLKILIGYPARYNGAGRSVGYEKQRVTDGTS